MPADLPALARLTEDVVAAMHTAERRERRRHASRTRRGFGLLAVVLALLIPSGLAVHAATADGASLPPDQGHAHDVATAAGACSAGAVVAVAATRAAAGRCAVVAPSSLRAVR